MSKSIFIAFNKVILKSFTNTIFKKNILSKLQGGNETSIEQKMLEFGLRGFVSKMKQF